MKDIFKFVEEKTGIKAEELKNGNRDAKNVYARRLFIFLAKKKRYSHAKIGREIRRDHTTVIHHFLAIENDKELKEYFEKVTLDFVSSKDKEKEDLIIRRVGIGGKYRWLYEKQRGKCVVCGFDEIVEVHHIHPKYLGGSEEPENLVLLCPNHHALIDRGMLFINEIDLNKNVDKPSFSTFPQA